MAYTVNTTRLPRKPLSDTDLASTKEGLDHCTQPKAVKSKGPEGIFPVQIIRN